MNSVPFVPGISTISVSYEIDSKRPKRFRMILMFATFYVHSSVKPKSRFIIARKRSLGQCNIFTGVCLSTWGCAWWRPPRTATAAGGTHPTGMHSCISMILRCVHTETETDKNGLFMIVWRYSCCTEPLIPLGIVAIVSVSGSVDAALMS